MRSYEQDIAYKFIRTYMDDINIVFEGYSDKINKYKFSKEKTKGLHENLDKLKLQKITQQYFKPITDCFKRHDDCGPEEWKRLQKSPFYEKTLENREKHGGFFGSTISPAMSATEIVELFRLAKQALNELALREQAKQLVSVVTLDTNRRGACTTLRNRSATKQPNGVRSGRNR